MILAGIFAFAATVFYTTAQENQRKDYLFTFKGKNKTHTVGVYGGLYGSYSEVENNPAGYLGYRLGFVLDNRLTIGLGGFGLAYEERFAVRQTENETCHLEAGYAGLFIEYLQPLGKRTKLGFSLLMADGIAQYKLDKEFEENKTFHQIYVDRKNFHVTEPGIELSTRLAGRWWIGAYATYRSTSPVKLIDTDEDILRNFSTGISLKYGIF